MRIMKALALILYCAATVPQAIAQTEAKANSETVKQSGLVGVITGRVVNDAGRPVAGAPIFFIEASGKSDITLPGATTDDEGNFKATELGAGSYTISTSVPGYVFAQADSERNYHRLGERVTVNLIKGGVITGRVTDSYGEPMVGTSVQAFKARELEGGQKYSAPHWRAVATLTDDRGVYRLYGLTPGVYVIGASSDESGLHSGYAERDAMTWHPASSRAAAVEITVRSGEEASGVDIRHREERGHAISGTLAGDAARTSLGERATIILTSGADRQLVGVTWANGERSFRMFGALDGEYEIVAFLPSSRETDFAISTPRRVVVKGADVSGIELKIHSPASISGRVKIESSAVGASEKNPCEEGARPKDRASIEEILLSASPEDVSRSSLQSIMLQLRSLSGDSGAAPDQKGEFALTGLTAGRFRIKADLPDESWYIRAITQPAAGAAKKNADASRNAITLKSGEKLSGFEVIIAEGAAGLKGRVAIANEKPPSRLRVHLIPAEVAAADEVLRYFEATVRADGSFEFKHIAPGKYLLHARQTTEKDANNDPLRPLAWDAAERAKLRKDAEAMKVEIELKPCQRVVDQIVKQY